MNEKGDLIELLIAFFGTILFGPIVGVVIAIGLAVLEFVYRSATPYIGVEGRVAETTLYKDVSIFPGDLFPQDSSLIVQIWKRLMES